MRRITDLTGLLCTPDTSIRDALAVLTESDMLFLLVVDPDRRLLGTFTDSDVRRAILRGVRVDAPVSECVQVRPITGHPGADAENRTKLRDIPGLVVFLPIVDPTGRVCEVWVADGPPRVPTALVMAGGQGTRLGALTSNIPKPLLPVGGRPILEHILGRLEGDGIDTVFVSVHYLAEKIESFLRERGNLAKVQLLRESRPLGTAGAIASLPCDDEEGILVVNGDLVTSTSFAALSGFHRRQGYDATITVATYEHTVPYGIVRHGDDGLFLGIDEKPAHTFFVAAGIYMLSKEVTALVPPDVYMDMPELLNRARSVGLKVGLFPVHEYWRDVGRPSDLDEVIRDHDAGRTS